MIKRLLTAFLCLLLCSAPLYAHDTATKCSNTKSTGDQLQCLNTHYEKQQKALNTAFTAALNDLTPGQLKTMKTAQNAWVLYRDLECSFEAVSTENASLERMETLKCLSVLTKDRIHTITMIEDETPTSQLGILPRWMNVLGKEHPNILWDYAGRIEGDFDCDTQNEYAMSGMETTQNGEQKAVIALAESTKTGKPKTQILSLPLEMKKCDKKISLSLINKEGAEKSCPTSLQVSDGECYTALITSSEKIYALGVNSLAAIPTPEEKPTAQASK